MAELPEPEATGSNTRVRIVVGVVVLVILGLIANSIKKNITISGLSSKDMAVRKHSAEVLIADKSLTDILSRQGVPTKRLMIKTFAEMKSDAAAGELVALMKDRNPTVQNEAQVALEQMMPVSLPKLVDSLKSTDLNVKNRAADAFIRIGPSCLDVRKDADGKDSVALLAAVTEAGARPGLTQIVTTLISRAGSDEEREALKAKVVPWLEKYLTDDKAAAGTKAGAIDILARINAQSTADAIRKLLDDPKVDPAVRKAALVGLGRLKYRDAFDLLQKALAESDVSIQNTAIVGFGQLQDPRAVELIKPFLSGYNESLRDAGVAALTKIGPAALPALAELLKNPRYEVRVGVLGGLDGIEDPRVVGVLAGALKTDPDENVRCKAADALGRRGAPAVAPLVAALGDKSWRVAAKARDSLGLIGKPAVSSLVAVLAKGEDSLAAFYAQSALEKIGPNAVEPLIAMAQGSAVPAARERAVLALGAIGDQRALSVLEALATSGADDLRPVADRALKQLHAGHRVS